MAESSKEKLEADLQFLKESYDSELLTKEEYETAKERIEQKLKKIPKQKAGPPPDVAEKEVIQPSKKNGGPAITEVKKKEEKSQQDTVEEIPVSGKIAQKKNQSISEQEVSVLPTSSDGDTVPIIQEKKQNTWLWVVVFFIAVGGFLYFSSVYQPQLPSDVPVTTLSSLSALQPELYILTSPQCPVCRTQRMESIIQSWFPNIKVTEVDYSSKLGSELTSQLAIDMLPAYIIKGDIGTLSSYISVARIFRQDGGYYIMSPNAAGAVYYITKTPQKNTIELFISGDDETSMHARANVEEFVRYALPDVIFSTNSLDSPRAQELHIETVPSVVINGVLLVRGVQSPRKIQEAYCTLNHVRVCEEELSDALLRNN